jgi:hypothetical protein
MVTSFLHPPLFIRFSSEDHMNAGVKMFRSLMLLGAVAALFAFEGAARAACVNDVDCTTGPSCGGDVCDYSTGTPTCKAAGTQPQGSDGWCAHDSDCKCMGQGATCAVPYCTFTKPQTGSGGSSGTDAGAAGSGAAGAGAAGAGAAGSATTTDGGTKSGSSSGCAVGGSGSGGLATLVGLGLVVAGLARRRRRA